jgi:hypothetical protein
MLDELQVRPAPQVGDFVQHDSPSAPHGVVGDRQVPERQVRPVAHTTSVVQQFWSTRQHRAVGPGDPPHLTARTATTARQWNRQAGSLHHSPRAAQLNTTHGRFTWAKVSCGPDDYQHWIRRTSRMLCAFSAAFSSQCVIAVGCQPLVVSPVIPVMKNAA